MKHLALPLALALLAATPLDGLAQNGNDKPPTPAPTGSAGFCLFELPTKDGVTRFVNLGIVQYVELNRERVRLTYGGGNFGSGYDADIPVKNRDEGLETIRRIQQTARECARHMPPGAMNGMSPMGANAPATRNAAPANGNPPDSAPPPNHVH